MPEGVTHYARCRHCSPADREGHLSLLLASRATPLRQCQVACLQVADEVVGGGVGDHDVDLGGDAGLLRGDAAGPKHGYDRRRDRLARRSEVRVREIGPDRLGVADVDGRSVSPLRPSAWTLWCDGAEGH